MNRVWVVTMTTADAAQKLLLAVDVKVKDRPCLLIDPNNREVRLKLHWFLHGVADEDVRVALSPCGKVLEVTREKWRAPGLEDAESTTRLVRTILKEGLFIDELPHMFKFYEGEVLVVVPGRPPICLRCKRTGHIRRDCRTPRCSLCRSFGHEREGCVRTYAPVSTGTAPPQDDGSELLMDQEELENAGAPPPPGLRDGPAFQQPELPAGNEKS
ncbi:uncharacterized protein LOC144134122 [Amblyomma americanum]